MNEDPKERRKAWRAQARLDLRRPWFWCFMGCLYVATFLGVAALMFILDLVVPHLPWISKPYVDPDPPPLITAFYCANLIPAMLVIAIPVLYIIGEPRRIPFLSSNKNANSKS